MPSSRFLRLLSGAAGIGLLLLVVAVVFVAPIRFRAQILLEKAMGRLPDLEWSDLSWLLRAGSGLDLGRMATTQNPYESVASPRHSSGDIEAGSAIFREQCASCHGQGGRGGPGGPALQNHVFRQGRSDWGLYRTTTIGIPGTAMVGRRLPRDDAWRLVSYLKQVLVMPSLGAEKDAPHPLTMQPVTPAELRSAEDSPAQWLTYSGSYASHRYSRLMQINRRNVAELRVEWQRQLETPVDKVESSPLVRGSTMFVTEPPNRVLALDAVSGRVIWTYSRDLPAKLVVCCGPVNRGVALLGDRVFVGTLDAHLVALNASTGEVEWDVAVAQPSRGYAITGAPLAVDNMVVTGIAGGEYGTRGFLDAYDAATGKRRWRFYTIPEAGQPGGETWEGNSWRTGGAPTWLTGSYDPGLRLIYWGVGNPSPNFYGENRKGDNLYTNSVVALESDSGKLRWYFQFTPHDLHDWDSVQIPVLIDAVVKGTKRKLMAWANRNGFYYLLDRENGKLLLGTPYMKQTWAEGLDANGRPKVRLESVPTAQGSEVFPGIAGATNWWSPAYDPQAGLLYVPTVDKGAIFYGSSKEPLDEFGENLGGTTTPIPNEDAVVAVKAIEVTSGTIRWEHRDAPRRVFMQMNGLMSTAGKLVFGGDAETLFALDGESGKELWSFPTGAEIWAAPMSYEVNGRQYVAVAAGRSVLAFTLARSNPRGRPRNDVR